MKKRLISFLRVFTHVDSQQLKQFGVVFAILVSVIFGGVLPWILAKPITILPWLIGAVVLLTALMLPKVLLVIYWPMLYLGKVLGRINSFLLLTLIYYFLLCPLSFLMKMTSLLFPNKNGRESANSNWDVSQKLDKDDFTRPF